MTRHILTPAERASVGVRKATRPRTIHYSDEMRAEIAAELKRQIALAVAEAPRTPLWRGGWP